MLTTTKSAKMSLDIEAARLYLRGVSALASEGAGSPDARITVEALTILRAAPATIDDLLDAA